MNAIAIFMDRYFIACEDNIGTFHLWDRAILTKVTSGPKI